MGRTHRLLIFTLIFTDLYLTSLHHTPTISDHYYLFPSFQYKKQVLYLPIPNENRDAGSIRVAILYVLFI